MIFNPAETKRMLMNYFYTKNSLELQKIPTFTIELVYEGREPEIKDAFHVHAKSVMFHKENLYRVLEKKIPKKYTKLAFLDCDIVFDDPDWYANASKLLDTHDIVQPFETAHWSDLTYSKVILTRPTVLQMKDKVWNFQYHPGFAWCMRRDWYNQHGFFDYAVSGSGDTLSSAAWMKKTFPTNFQSLPFALKEAYTRYSKLQSPRMTHLKCGVYHLYHGSRAKRMYSERHKMLNVNQDIQKMTHKNKDGVLEWNEPDVWNPLFLDYFASRNDDDLGEDRKEPLTS